LFFCKRWAPIFEVKQRCAPFLPGFSGILTRCLGILPKFSGIFPGFLTNQSFWVCACIPCTPASCTTAIIYCSIISLPRQNCPALQINHKCGPFRYRTVLGFALDCAKLVCFVFCYYNFWFVTIVCFLMPDGSLERKGRSEIRNAKWKTYNRRKILEASKAKTSFRTIASAVGEPAVCLHRRFAT